MSQQRPAPDGPQAGGSRPAAAGPARARVLLLLVAVALVVHGSLYPWHFEMPASVDAALRDMLGRRRWWTRLDDVLGNIVLFLPLSALAQWVAQGWLSSRRAAALVFVAGLALALGLQVLQLFVPWRDAELTDVLWNGVGLVAGLVLALLTPAAQVGLAGPPAGRTALQSAQLRLAAMLAVLWLALHWWPFIPASGFDAIKEALRQAWSAPHWQPLVMMGTALGVVVVGELVRPLDRRMRLLLSLCTLSMAGRLLTLRAALPPSMVLGMALGVLGAALAWRMPGPAARRALFWAVLLWFAADELRPYRLSTFAREFHWVPFTALLHGSMLGNLLALCWNLFWLGAAVSLGGARRGASWRVTLGLMVGVALLEGAQTRLAGRNPDITPALLPALWWLVSRAALPVDRTGRADNGLE